MRKPGKAVFVALVAIGASAILTKTVLAQMEMRERRPMERGEGMRGGGGMMGGIGAGINILGGTVMQEMSKPQDDGKPHSGGGGGNQSTIDHKRAAKKGGPGKDGKGGGGTGGGKKPDDKTKEAKKGDDAPTPVTGDPKDGFEVTGGQVHRGTGTITGYKGGPRPGIYCWVHRTDKTKCERFAQYQFVTVNIEAKWGNNPSANINDDVKKAVPNGYILNGNGAHVIPGQLGGDDYNDRNEHVETNAHMKDADGTDRTAGPYAPKDIPEGGGDKGLIDAPYWNETAGWLADTKITPDELRKQQTKKSVTQPQDEDIGTLKFLQHFRTYVYCMKPRECLGYFEWDYDETVTIVRRWKLPSGGSDVAKGMFGDNMKNDDSPKKTKGKGKNAPPPPEEPPAEKTWVSYLDSKKPSVIDGPRVGKWVAGNCP